MYSITVCEKVLKGIEDIQGGEGCRAQFNDDSFVRLKKFVRIGVLKKS